MSNTSARTITVPTDTAQPFATGALVYLQNINTGTVSVTGASGVTVQALGSALALAGQHSSGVLFKRDTNTWTFINLTRGLG